MEDVCQEENLKINSEIIIESIQILEEYLLHEENEDSNILELFCEYDFIEILKIFVFGSKDKIIIEQIIKLLNSLIKNILKETFLYYLMSNNFINNIISRSFNFLLHDKNFLDIYINFLEVLSSKLNINTVQFLFQEEKGRFPLLDETIKLYNYPDNKIRQLAKNIILSIIKIEYNPLRNYLCSLPSISYFCFLACELKDLIVNLSNETQKDNNINGKIKKDLILILINDIKNNLIHIQNIFEINCDKINYILINCLFYYCIIPYVIYNLNCEKEKIKNSGKKIKKSICILFINMLFIYIKNDLFLNILFSLIFFPYKSIVINNFMENKPIQPINYYYNWNQNIKNSSESFLNYIQFHFNSSFIKSIIYSNKSRFSEIQQIYKKYQDKLINKPDLDYEKNQEKLLKDITKDILNKLTFSEISIMTSYHSYLSVATGVNCGLSTKNGDLCIIKKMKIFFQKYFNNKKEKINELIPNYIKYDLFRILNKKKSNKKILLINILLKIILVQNKNLSKALLKEVNIISGNDLNEGEVNLITNKYKDKYNNNFNTFQKGIQIENIYKKNIYNSINTSLFKNENKIKNNIINISNKENCDPNIKDEQNYVTDIFKKDNIVNTMISLNTFVKNSGNSIIEPVNNIINMDNNCQNENEFILNKKRNESVKKEESPFNTINKYSFMDKEYFINLEKKLEQDNIYYNENLIDILISLIDMNKDIDILSKKIIIDNILSLVTKQNRSFISMIHKNKIELIYEKYKNEIIRDYNNKKFFHNNAYQLFIKQYDNYLKIMNLNFIDIIIKDANLILSNDFESNFLLNNNIYINKENKYDKIILSFLLIHDFYYRLVSSENYYSNNKTKEKDNSFKNNNLYINFFSLLKRIIPLKINHQYDLINLDSDIKYYDCKIKIIVNKIEDDKGFFDGYLLLLDNFLFIGDSSNNSCYITIKYKFFINNCSIQSDEYNNKNMNIFINNNTYDNNDFEILFDFKNYNTAKNIKGLIQQEIKKAKFFEKDKIKNFIQNLN